MVNREPDVLVDVTPLALGSRQQGIGTYIVGLTRAMAGLPAEELRGLRVAALVDWRGGVPQLAPLGEAADRVRTWEDAAYSDRTFVWRRRFELGRAVRRAAPRLVHLTEAIGMPLLPGCPRVVTCHDLIPLLFIERYARRRPALARLRRLPHELVRYHGARRVIADSEATKRDLCRLLRVPRAKIDVVLLGIDAKLFLPRREAGERALLQQVHALDRPYVLYVGSGDPRKNLPFLVEAFAASGLAKNMLLALAGSFHHSHRPMIEDAVDRYGLREHARLLGYVSEAHLPALYRNASVFAFPSLYEGFGLPILEAMACGTPVVTTDCGSLAEAAGEVALTARPGDIEAWAAALRRAVTDDGWRRAATAAGREQARRFTWAACARATVASYRAALQ
ncbi:glycosyltransferase family 1 protein [Gryllotalpicola sp.]|uniref:glycosyltransferase family 4 protein n=1 Tax=Gryllotalpicola sp. TaxID=1932787 RepID=UPI00260E55D4|nr:glycosyltransferase family 1 protein [Gryllotalpicola sp.]